MANEILATSQLSIRTRCPVHIGEGDPLTRMEFVLVENGVFVISEPKLMRWLNGSSNLQLMDQFTIAAERGASISEFLKTSRKDPAELAAYAIRSDFTPGKPVRDIRPFMKTAYYQPYLAGSSLKGSLRSSLLRGAMLANPELRVEANRIVFDEASKPKPRSGSEEVEARAFVARDVNRSRYSNYDLNRVLVIHDSAALETKHLELIEVQVLSVQTSGRLAVKMLPNGREVMSIYVEALRPRVEVNMNLTWQRNLLMGQGEAKELNFKEIRRLMIYLPEYCRAASLNVIAQEIDFYHRGGQKALAGWFETQRDLMLKSPDEVFLLPIGWGSGYDPKTITDLLEDATFEIVADNLHNTKGLGRPRNDRDEDWLGPELSPKSRKVCVRKDGSLEPIGWLAVALLPGEGPGAGWIGVVRSKLVDEKPAFETTPARPPVQSGAVEIFSVEPPVKRDTLQRDEAEAPGETPSGPQIEASQKLPATPASEPQKQLAIIDAFKALPQIGDIFHGEIFEIEGEVVRIFLPGLDDVVAYGVLSRGDFPPFGPPHEGGETLCEVTALEPESPRTTRVRCKLVEA